MRSLISRMGPRGERVAFWGILIFAIAAVIIQTCYIGLSGGRDYLRLVVMMALGANAAYRLFLRKSARAEGATR